MLHLPCHLTATSASCLTRGSARAWRSQACSTWRSIQGARRNSSLQANGLRRKLLSRYWVPRGPDPTASSSSSQDRSQSQQQLLQAGFLSQRHAGIVHLLPFGLRVQDKLCALIRYHLDAIDATEVSLSSFSTPSVWRETGRLGLMSQELFQFADRKNRRYLLSPTHEEEITNLVREQRVAQRQLPLRVFQISRKYRDEPRPRGGLLRGREFLMKDLYTFDVSEEQAQSSYEAVRSAYEKIFGALNIPYLVAKASSGKMGGSMSDEIHFVSERGEDMLLRCDSCANVINSETLPDGNNPFAASKNSFAKPSAASKNRKGANQEAPQGDETSEAFPLPVRQRESIKSRPAELPKCPQCSTGYLSEFLPAIEVAHLFNLGTKYSSTLKLGLDIPTPDSPDSTYKQPLQMGCHGIGVSRLVAAIADQKSDAKGLNWPRVVAPFEVLVTSPAVRMESLNEIHDILATRSHGSNSGLDVAIDDRGVNWGWKINDADIVGYPVIVVVGKKWDTERKLEVQCRQLAYIESVAAADLRPRVEELLTQL